MSAFSIFIFMLGLCVGSFLNVCAYRIPKNISVVFPRSHCPVCSHNLNVMDLIPVASYIFLGAKCRYCGKRISPRYLAVEIITAALFLIIFHAFTNPLDVVLTCIFISIMLVIVLIDIDFKIIPDELIIVLIFIGAINYFLNLFFNTGYDIYGDNSWLNGILGAFIPAFMLFMISFFGSLLLRVDEALGMGDVKLFIPIGLFLGWKLSLTSLLFSFICGGIFSIVLLLTKSAARKTEIPFAPFIAVGVFVALFWGWDLINWYFGFF